MARYTMRKILYWIAIGKVESGIWELFLMYHQLSLYGSFVLPLYRFWSSVSLQFEAEMYRRVCGLGRGLLEPPPYKLLSQLSLFLSIQYKMGRTCYSFFNILFRFSFDTADNPNNLYFYMFDLAPDGEYCQAVFTKNETCGYVYHSSEVQYVLRTGPDYG